MNNLASYFGLVDAKIRASDKDLPVLSLTSGKLHVSTYLSRLHSGLQVLECRLCNSPQIVLPSGMVKLKEIAAKRDDFANETAEMESELSKKNSELVEKPKEIAQAIGHSYKIMEKDEKIAKQNKIIFKKTLTKGKKTFN